MPARCWFVVLALAAGASACNQAPPPPSTSLGAGLSGVEGRADVFTPAHASTASAVRDFFLIRPAATQPIPFPHKTHVEKAMLKCTETCHESVVKGPNAGIPSVKTCMICHDSIATDRPLIMKITNDYYKKGIDLPWQRVYGFTPEVHVRFNHAPHIRANVDCATCHGDIAHQTVAERNVDHSMGFCVDCHKAKKASNDCLTCHF
jgi:hypothetical protein